MTKYNLNPSPEPLSDDDDSEEAARAAARRQEAKIFTIILSHSFTSVCVLQKSAIPDPFVGGSTGGDVKQSKKAYFLLHYVPTKLPISQPPSRHNSFID